MKAKFCSCFGHQCCFEQAAACLIDRAKRLNLPRPHIGIGLQPRPGETLALDLPRPLHSLADDRALLSGPLIAQLLEIYSGYFHMDVNPIGVCG